MYQRHLPEKKESACAKPTIKGGAIDGRERAALGAPAPAERLQGAQTLRGRLAVAHAVVVPASHLGQSSTVGEVVRAMDRTWVARLQPAAFEVVAVHAAAWACSMARMPHLRRHVLAQMLGPSKRTRLRHGAALTNALQPAAAHRFDLPLTV